MKTKPEAKVKQHVKAMLSDMNAWWYMPVQSGRGEHGVPDFVACVPTEITQEMVGNKFGMFFGIETKAPGKINTVTPLQMRQLLGIKKAGGVAILTDGEIMQSISLPKT